MNTKDIAKALENKKAGTIFTLVTSRPAKTRKGVTDSIIKTSVMQGMTNTNYANRAPVKEAVRSGERDAPELPSHIKESFTVDGIRFWRGNNGNEYFPVCITGNKPQNTWTRNGVEVDFDSIKDLLLASEYPKPQDKEKLAEKGQAPFIAVGLSNIAELR